MAVTCDNKNQSKRPERMLVKVGTSTLTHASGKLNLKVIDRLARILVDIYNQGTEIILVSSGAIGVGIGRVSGLNHKKMSLSEKQAMAAVGQGVLLHIYEKSFAEYGQIVAQILLTRGDLDDRIRFINARNTLSELLKLNIIPIINENDTVSSEEIRFGDNDSLAALVAALIDVDHVVLLTDIDGLYTKNPHDHSDAEKVDVVHEINDAVRAMAGQTRSGFGTGGMVTKLQAAEITMGAGIPMTIADGADPSVLYDIVEGIQVGTLFQPKTQHLHSRTCWLVYGSKAKGSITLDDGAVEAVTKRGKSLLPSGIIDATGSFQAGDVVSLVSSSGKIIAKGISNFSMKDVLSIRGLHSDNIPEIIENAGFDVVVHRDNMGLESGVRS